MKHAHSGRSRDATDRIWTHEIGDGPVVAVALHDGHAVREEIAALMSLDGAERLREEDPHTGTWAHVAATRIIALRSRFEVDLNRPRDHAVYRAPDDAWGLPVWKDGVPDAVVARSLAQYDAFYANARSTLRGIEFKKFFMDEWTGAPDLPLVDAIRDALESTIAGVMVELEAS